MLDESTKLLIIASLLAAIPIAVWLYITIKNEANSKKTMLMAFGFGCLTAPALLGIQVAWEGGTPVVAVLIPIFILMVIVCESILYKMLALILLILSVIAPRVKELGMIWEQKLPNFNLVDLIDKNFTSGLIISILTLILFATLEENIKLYVMRTIDKKTLFISKINDAIRYGIAAALGFSFAENIYYLYSWWPSISSGEIASMYFFRSIFTTAAHMTYSGIFGYYYGIGKFSMVINQENIIEGKKDKMSDFIAKFFNLPPSEGFRQKTILKGLFIAIGMHFSINLMLELQQTYNIRIMYPIVVLSTISMYLFLQHLMNRKAGHLILLTDPSTKKTSSIGKKDEDVVIELLSMWLKDQRYVDVIHICERLLERDPDNNVVKLFKARAMDEMDEKNIYKQVLGSIIKTNDQLSTSDKSVITKYVEQKEKIKKTEIKETKKAPEVKINNPPQIIPKKANLVEKLTGEGTFKL